MTKVTSLRRIRWAQLAMQANGFEPWLPAYMIARHFSWHEILLLLAIRQVVGFPLQYPTGRFADHISTKASLVIGASLCLISMSLFVQANIWPSILIASLIGVVGKSFFAGADGSLVRAIHRDLYPEDWKDHFGLFMARFARYQGLAEASASLAATLLAVTLGLWAVIAAQGFMYLAVLLLVAPVREPRKLTKQTEEPSRYYTDPTDRVYEILGRLHPAAALTLCLSVCDPEFVPSRSNAKKVEELGLGSILPDGRLLPHPSFAQDTYTGRVPVHPAGQRPYARRRRPMHVMQLPPTGRGACVLKVTYTSERGSPSYRVIEPEVFRKSWPSVHPRPAVGGPWVPVRGPSRQLTGAEYVEQINKLERKEIRRKRLSLAALIVAVGAIASLTAVTYRVAPLYYASISFRGKPLPTAGYGLVLTTYLASLWVMGLGYGWLNRLSVGKKLGAMAGLATIGGACYVLFGLIGAVWGLSALLGLAMVRAQEAALSTTFFNDLSSTRNQAGVLSMLRMMQDGMAAGAILGLSWWTHTHSLGMGLIVIGAIHATVACLAIGALAYLYRP